MRVGDTIDVELYAVSSDGTDQSLFSVEVVFTWDPDVLVFVNKIDNPPWAISSFFDDRSLARLNADCGPDLFCDPFRFFPVNDGDAFFIVSTIAELVIATGEGLLVATFQFMPVAVTAGTVLRIIEGACSVPPDRCSSTRVLPFNGGEVLTGRLGSLALIVAACGSKGDFNNDCLVESRDFEEFERCLAGPGESPGLGCEASDFDGDGDTDLRDAAGLQRWVTGP